MTWKLGTHGEIFEKHPKINSFIFSEYPPPRPFNVGDISWSEERRERLSSRYILSESQRNVVLQEGNNPDSDRNDDILKKRDLLPERIRHLLEDIAVLHDSPYFSQETWEEGPIKRKKELSPARRRNKALRSSDVTTPDDLAEAEQRISSDVDHYEVQISSQEHLWKELLDMTPRVSQVRGDDVFLTQGERASPEVRFGFEIGNFLRALRPTGNNQKDYDDLLWGLILAFTGRPLDEVAEVGEELESLFDDFQERHTKRTEEAERVLNMDDINRDRKYVEQAIREGIERTGTTAHEIVVKEVNYHHPKIVPGQLEETESSETPSADVDDRPSNEAEGDSGRSSPDSKKERATDINRGRAAKIARKLKEVTPLEEANNLYETLSKDIEVVTDTSIPGSDSALHVLEGLEKVRVDTNSGENGESDQNLVTSEAIGAEISTDKNRVTETFNHLANNPDKDLWTNEPVVTESSGTRRGKVWNLTAYGELLTYCCLESNCDAGWIFRFALGPEELALTERQMVINTLDELGDL